MKYEILSGNSQIPGYKLNELQALLEKSFNRLKKYLKKYRRPINVEVHIKKTGAGSYMISFVTNLRKKPLIVKEKDKDILRAASLGFESFKNNLVKQLSLEKRHAVRRIKLEDFDRYEELKEPLNILKKEEEKEVFVSLLKKVLPGLKGFIRRRIKQAHISRTLRLKAEKDADLIDELYFRLYDNYTGHLYDFTEFQKWVYTEAGQLLNEIVHYEQSRMEPNFSVEQILKTTTRDLSEEYSREADGGFIMMEEFDDPAYLAEDMAQREGLHDYYQIFTDGDETEMKILQKTEDDLSLEELETNIHGLLINLPKFKQNIFDLYMFEHLEIEEIAGIMEMDSEKIRFVIDEVKAVIRESILPK